MISRSTPAKAKADDRGSEPERALAQELLWLKLPAPVREHRFSSFRRWRFDFAWPEYMLAVEVEGGHWVGGHGGERFDQDCEKYNTATTMGWRILRVTPAQVTSGEAIGWIIACLAQRGGMAAE